MSIVSQKPRTRSEQIAYVLKNQEKLKAFKKAQKCYGKQLEGLPLNTAIAQRLKEKAQAANDSIDSKALGYANPDLPQDTDEVIYRSVVANATMWMDTYGDVPIPGVYKQSVNAGTKNLFGATNHRYDTDNFMGKIMGIRTEMVPLERLGIAHESIKETECLVLDHEIVKSYNSKAFEMYVRGDANQHSIGYYLMQFELAADDKDFEKEYARYQQYIDLIINSQDAKDWGYFWCLKEIKLIENSLVMRGACELTPTLEPEPDAKTTAGDTPDNKALEPSSDTLESKERAGENAQIINVYSQMRL